MARQAWAAGHPGDTALQKQGCGGATGQNDDGAGERGGAASPLTAPARGSGTDKVTNKAMG